MKYLNKTYRIYLAFLVVVLIAWQKPELRNSITWKLDNIHLIGGQKTLLWAEPVLKYEDNQTAIYFNGIDDGIVLDTIPIAGADQFTVEVLFKPDADGYKEPRIMHFEDDKGNRGTFELRLTNNGEWYMDTFLKNADQEIAKSRLTLIDSTILHPAGKWYWAAMVYDGKKMCSFVNASKELEGELNMQAFGVGKLSLGTRLNKVHYFKGMIAEIRFHPRALRRKELQHY